jgi:hypothetical protein
MKKLQITGLSKFAIRAFIVENDLDVIVLASRICGTLIVVAVTVPSMVHVPERSDKLPSSSMAFQGMVKAP